MVLSAESRSFLLILVLCACFLCDPACANANFSYGMDCFSNGKYEESAKIFEQCINETSDDKEAYFFAAKSYEKIGNLNRARAIYVEIVQKFPKSSYAHDAVGLIKRIDESQYSANETNGQPISLPANSLAVDYELTNRNITIPVEINGHTWRMIFDTGANHSMIGKNHLRQLGLSEPNWETSHHVINSMGKNPVWKISVRLEVDRLTLPYFRMYVTENMPTIYPSLGQNFIKQFNFLVDAKNKKLHFVKRSENKAFEEHLRAIASIIPFRHAANDLILVDAKVNEVPCEMAVDIGASKTVFTRSELEQLGISIPPDAGVQSTNTMVGKTQVRTMTLDSVQLGPIQKFNLPTQIHDVPSYSKPLIGLNFFKDISFYVDYDRSEILIFNTGGN